jgi:hypothetical protein
MHRNLLTQLPDGPGYIANKTPLILNKQTLGVIDLHSFCRIAVIRMEKGGTGTFYAGSGNDRSIIVLVLLTVVAAIQSRKLCTGSFPMLSYRVKGRFCRYVRSLESNPSSRGGHELKEILPAQYNLQFHQFAIVWDIIFWSFAGNSVT